MRASSAGSASAANDGREARPHRQALRSHSRSASASRRTAPRKQKAKKSKDRDGTGNDTPQEVGGDEWVSRAADAGCGAWLVGELQRLHGCLQKQQEWQEQHQRAQEQLSSLTNEHAHRLDALTRESRDLRCQLQRLRIIMQVRRLPGYMRT